MEKLPKSKNPIGYTKVELQAILKELKIKYSIFSKAFGINTCSLNEKGETLYYHCDVERALWIIGNKLLGRHRMWD